MKFQELQNEHINLKNKLKEIQEKNENLENNYNSQKSVIQTLQEKREASLHEIHKLSNEIVNLKSSLASNNTPKMKSSGFSNQGFNGAMDSQQGKKEESKKDEILKKDEIVKKEEIIKRDEINTPAKSALLKKKMEAKFLGSTKKELESLYREMLEMMLPIMKDAELNKAFIKVEKKLNDTIRRAQDHIDNLLDM